MDNEVGKDVAEPLAQPPQPVAAEEAGKERPAGNMGDRLFRLEQMNATLNKRVEFLEENQAKTQMMIREEAMRLLGMTFCSIGEQLLTGVTSMHKYKAEVVSDERPINEQTFYARRVDPANPQMWAYHILQANQASDVILERLAEPMRAAILSLVATVPADIDQIAFNVYKMS